MAVRGRKPKPTALKKLEGNPSKRPLNHKEPTPKKGLPICPNWLESEAKTEWKRMCGILGPMGLLTEMDMTAFAGYCQAYARWKAAEEYFAGHSNQAEESGGQLLKDCRMVLKAVMGTERFKNCRLSRYKCMERQY